MTLQLTDMEYHETWEARTGYVPLGPTYLSTHHGLGIAKTLKNTWRVVHVPSREYLFDCRTQKRALAAVNDLIDAGHDWTLSAAEMYKVKNYRYADVAADARKRWGIWP